MTIWIPTKIATPKVENRIYTIKGLRNGREYRNEAWYIHGRWRTVSGEWLKDVTEINFAIESEDL